MSSLDNFNRFEITSGSITIKPIWEWFTDNEDVVIENNVKKGTYVCFGKLYKKLYIVNLDWFKQDKQGKLKYQKWVRSKTSLLIDRAFVGVFETEQVPSDETSHDVFFNKYSGGVGSYGMHVSEKGAVVEIEPELVSIYLRYYVLRKKNQIIGLCLDLDPQDDECSTDEEL